MGIDVISLKISVKRKKGKMTQVTPIRDLKGYLSPEEVEKVIVAATLYFVGKVSGLFNRELQHTNSPPLSLYSYYTTHLTKLTSVQIDRYTYLVRESNVERDVPFCPLSAVYRVRRVKDYGKEIKKSTGYRTR